MWRPRSVLRWAPILLLLALRAGQRPVEPEGGVRRPRGLREGANRSLAAHGRMPPEGGAGIRPATGPDRGPHRRVAYLYLEVHRPPGSKARPWRLIQSSRVGNLYAPSSVRRRVRLQERRFGGFAGGSLPVGCRQCTDGAKMVLFVTGLCSFHCFYCPVSDEKMY